MAPRIELFAFRYRDPRTGKWIRARYVATRDEIAQRHSEWEITGPAEVRDVDPEARRFTSHRRKIQMRTDPATATELNFLVPKAIGWRSLRPDNA
jgi:hypothetical protein